MQRAAELWGFAGRGDGDAPDRGGWDGWEGDRNALHGGGNPLGYGSGGPGLLTVVSSPAQGCKPS